VLPSAGYKNPQISLSRGLYSLRVLYIWLFDGSISTARITRRFATSSSDPAAFVTATTCDAQAIWTYGTQRLSDRTVLQRYGEEDSRHSTPLDKTPQWRIRDLNL